MTAPDEVFIRRMIAAGYATDDDTMTHKVLFRLEPEPKTVKNRLHLDLRVGEENVDAQEALLAERSATCLHKSSQGPHLWVTMADPEDNEFCVS